MEEKKESRSVWWEVSSAGPCMLMKRLINRHNNAAFDPFSLLAVCYCSPEFDRADIIPPPPQDNRETLNYLVTGLVDPPDLEDEQLSRPGASRWVTVVGGLQQLSPTESVYVLNMELWMRIIPGTDGGGKRWEFESEDVPLVRTSGAEVRVLCGQYQHREGAISQHPLATTLFDVTLLPGGSFEYTLPKANTSFVYVFGGKVYFGQDEEVSCGKDSLVRLCDGKLVASSRASGGRFLLFSARPVVRKAPLVCPSGREVCPA